MNNSIYLPKYKLLFERDSGGFFIPIKYDVEYNSESNTFIGKRISFDSSQDLGRCLYMFIMFAKSSGVDVDNETGLQAEGYLDLYQYAIAYTVIKKLLLLDSSDIISAVARQAKNYWSV